MRVEDPLPLVQPKLIEGPTIILLPPKCFWYNPKLNNLELGIYIIELDIL
jgi:hypothetical protein